MSSEAQAAQGAQLIVGQVLYLERYGDSPADDLARAAMAKLDKIGELSGLRPTETLVIAGCLDALHAASEGQELEIVTLIKSYLEADNGNYIRDAMLGALDKFIELLDRLDDGLKKLGVPDEGRARWVREGLDYPDPFDGASEHIGRTHLDRDGWAVAAARTAAYLEHVAGLPARLRSGEVDLDTVIHSVGISLTAT